MSDCHICGRNIERMRLPWCNCADELNQSWSQLGALQAHLSAAHARIAALEDALQRLEYMVSSGAALELIDTALKEPTPPDPKGRG